MNERVHGLVREVARDLLDEVTEDRGRHGPVFAEVLADTAPEDRTWDEAWRVARKGGTDYGDGILGRRLDPTEESRELDRDADRKFSMPQQKQLALNGEIPPVHYALKVMREFGMQQLRERAEQHGIDVASSRGGKRKTAVEMGTLVTAHSPLATKSDLLRWEQSIATGFSLIDLAETGFRFRRELRGRNEANTSRNSKAREVTAGPFGKAASLLHRVNPDLRSSAITAWSERTVRFAANLLLMDPDHPLLATALFTGGGLGDGLDGRHAELTGQVSRQGMEDDIRADLRQQTDVFQALARTAYRRGNMVAASNYALAEMLTPLSAYYRAEAESQGMIVAEGGMGTRVWTAILAGAGMQFNRHQDISDILSGMIVAAKVNTIEERRDVIKHGEASDYCLGVKEEYRERFMEDAQVRRGVIEPYAKHGLAVGTILLARSGFPLVMHEAA